MFFAENIAHANDSTAEFSEKFIFYIINLLMANEPKLANFRKKNVIFYTDTPSCGSFR